MARLSFILTVLFFISPTFPANAQEYRPFPAPAALHGQGFLANPLYDSMAAQLVNVPAPPPRFDYGAFRGWYMQTRQYDPIGRSTRDELLDLAYRVAHGKDEADSKAALADYNALVKNHLANLAVVMQALSLSKEDPRFGNPKFFTNLRNGLLLDVVHSGDGLTLFGAYQAITLEEEAMLLDYLGVKVLNTEAAHSGAVYYNMHDVIDPATGRAYTVFVDISKPMEFLEEQHRTAFDGFRILWR